MDIKAVLQRHESLKRERQAWFPLYQALSQYVMLRKQDFSSESASGPFMLNKVYDSTAIHAAHMMASSILGQLWPNPYESFEFQPQVAQSEAVFSDAFEMMKTVNEVTPVNLAVPEANVMNSFHEVILDAVVYGTGAHITLETGDLRRPFIAKSICAKTLSFAENEHGQVDTAYMEKDFTVAKMIKRYGYRACSERVRKLYDTRKLEERVKVLQFIEPRRERNPLKLGAQDFPFAFTHIETDQENVLEVSGFQENPINVVRFWKAVGEAQGRSPAMSALSDIRALNKLVEIFEKAGEMGLNPPKMVSTEDVLGAGKIPWYPGADIPIHMSGRLSSGRPPIEPIMTVANPSWAQQRIADLRDNVMQYFMLDRLSDLNNTSRQTLGEANIRNELRMFMTGPLLIRLLLELVSPFLDRVFNILLEGGFYGVIRGSVQDFQMQAQGISPKYLSEDFINHRMSGLKGYRINFISPAARLMKLEEAQGLDRFTDYVLGKLAPANPGVLANFDFDEAARSSQKLFGASQKILRSPAEVQAQRQAEAEQSMQAQEMAAAQAQATTFRDAAKGVKDLGAA